MRNVKCRTQDESSTVLVGDLKRPNLIDSDVASQMQLTLQIYSAHVKFDR